MLNFWEGFPVTLYILKSGDGIGFPEFGYMFNAKGRWIKRHESLSSIYVIQYY